MTIRYSDYIQSDDWRTQRVKALKRADSHCAICGEVNGLDVHHNTYDRLGQEKPGDLVVLCEECHAMYHHRMTSDMPYLWFVTPETRTAIERMVLVEAK